MRQWKAGMARSFGQTNGTRPAELMPPDSGPGCTAQRSFDRIAGENGARSKAGNAFGELVVVRQIRSQSSEPAGVLEVRRTEGERRTQAEFPNTQKLRHQCARHEIGHDAESFPRGRKIVRLHPV